MTGYATDSDPLQFRLVKFTLSTTAGDIYNQFQLTGTYAPGTYMFTLPLDFTGVDGDFDEIGWVANDCDPSGSPNCGGFNDRSLNITNIDFS